MSSLAVKLGLGRALYHSWHRPRAAIVRCLREGGPWEQAITALGRKAMADAARGLPPLLPGKPGSLRAPVHVLTGRRHWYQTAFMLHSLARFEPIDIVVHDDGTLRDEAMAEMRRLAPFARFESGDEAEERLDKVLGRDRHPALRKRAAEYVHLRKLIDVHAGGRGWRLFIDSDILFFHRPEALIAWMRAPEQALHMIDAERSYGYDPALLDELAGQSVPDLINTGIVGICSEAIDWDRMEYWCRTLIERSGAHYFQEQALVALHLAGLPRAALPRPEYLVLPRPPETRECRAIAHHYVSNSKPSYFRHNWRRVLA